jgi:protein-L-isoaspartate(D-aspartate) O-methyltransferase
MVHFDEKDRFAIPRLQMVRQQLQSRDITDPAVLQVMGQVPREEFVPRAYRSQAYADGPLPIGMGQTISQPYIVALMTQMLELTPESEVLEIGTGSGYQTAILAGLAGKVYTVERHHQLSEAAQAVLGRLGISNVEFYIGDGSAGWREPRSFGRVMITAAVPRPPEPIVEQIAEAGVLVAPVGGGFVQSLCRYKKAHNRLAREVFCDCRFVKLLGRYGFKADEG